MDKRICVVGCDLGPGPMAYLREQFPEFEFLSYPRNAKVPDEVLARAEVLMNYGDKSQIAPAKNVRYIHTISAGIDGYIDEVDRCHGSALPVTNGTGVYSDAVGEHVIALLLAVVHGIVPSVRNMAEKQWPAIPMLGNVNGKTIAVLGTGDIGNNAARICAAMGARVLGFKLHACEPFPPYSEIYTAPGGRRARVPARLALYQGHAGRPAHRLDEGGQRARQHRQRLHRQHRGPDGGPALRPHRGGGPGRHRPRAPAPGPSPLGLPERAHHPAHLRPGRVQAEACRVVRGKPARLPGRPSPARRGQSRDEILKKYGRFRCRVNPLDERARFAVYSLQKKR